MPQNRRNSVLPEGVLFRMPFPPSLLSFHFSLPFSLSLFPHILSFFPLVIFSLFSSSFPLLCPYFPLFIFHPFVSSFGGFSQWVNIVYDSLMNFPTSFHQNIPLNLNLQLYNITFALSNIGWPHANNPTSHANLPSTVFIYPSLLATLCNLTACLPVLYTFKSKGNQLIPTRPNPFLYHLSLYIVL